MEKIKIILVDDDEGICDSLSRLFIKKGYAVDATSSGIKALKMIEKSSYDILLTDLKMPEISGIELLRQAKEIAPDMGAVIMTGFGEITSYLEAMDMGATEYLNKPIKSEELHKIIDRLMKKKKPRRSESH